MFKNGEILTILNKQVYNLKIADFPEYIRVDNTERWLSKWENLPFPQLQQKLSLSLRLNPHSEQNMMTSRQKETSSRSCRSCRVTPRTWTTADQLASCQVSILQCFWFVISASSKSIKWHVEKTPIQACLILPLQVGTRGH